MPTMEEQEAAMIANLAERTGRTYDAWAAVVAAAGESKHGGIVKLLKSHGVGHGYADAIARKFRANVSGPTENPLEALFAGRKAGLRPVYDRLVCHVEELADDIEVSPKKTYVSLRTTKQFALIQPSTGTRVDLGLRLPGVAATKRLEESGSFNNTVSHRVRLADPDEVDDEVTGWLRAAYELA